MSIQFLHQTRTDALSAECTRIGQMLHAACEATEPPMPRTHGPVAEIADRFGLTLFERDILTFAIAVEGFKSRSSAPCGFCYVWRCHTGF